MTGSAVSDAGAAVVRRVRRVEPTGSEVTAKHVALSGNMGVGKSTLTRLLADHLGAEALFETVDDHPYLERYYLDMPRWALHSQFCFLTQAFAQQSQIINGDGLYVQDRSIYEHFSVFATSLHRQGILAADDFEVLGKHFRALTAVVPGPDLMIHLTASVPTLQARIQQRARSMEQLVETAYLEHLEQQYAEWMAGYTASPVLLVDTDDVDITDPADRAALLQVIESELGLRQLALSVD